MTVTFTGVKNNRPTFEFGDRAPPEWLRELAARIQIKDGKAYIGSRELQAGEEVTQ